MLYSYNFIPNCISPWAWHGIYPIYRQGSFASEHCEEWNLAPAGIYGPIALRILTNVRCHLSTIFDNGLYGGVWYAIFLTPGIALFITGL